MVAGDAHLAADEEPNDGTLASLTIGAWMPINLMTGAPDQAGMKITVITVCRNSAATLQDTLESVLAQSWTGYVLVRQPQPGIAARTVASWPDRWAASAERLVRAAQLAWVVRHTLLARAAQTVWAAQTAQPTQTAGTAAPVCPVPLAAHHMLLSLARESEEPLA